MSQLKSWWTQADQFDWVSAQLHARGVLRPTRLLLAVLGATASLAPATLLIHRTEGGEAAAVVAGAAGAGFSLIVVWFFLRGWPTRRQSELFAVAGAVVISTWSLTQSNSALAALACTAMALTGGYIGLFHTPRLLAANLALACGISVSAAIRLAREYGPATAISAFWLILLLDLVVPLAIRGITLGMREFALRSDEDALTGLLNRRGFLEAVTTQLSGAEDTHYLTMLMVDLDNFKHINDTRGHAAGDRALLAVAELLQQRLPWALICRAGGEEFLVACRSDTGDSAAQIASGLCTAIAALPQNITASIGSVTTGLGDTPLCLHTLVDAADAAMYTAKRRGGNQIEHTVLS